MSQIDVVFCRVSDSEPQDYVTQRLLAMHTTARLQSARPTLTLTDQALGSAVDTVISSLEDAGDPPLARPPKLSKYKDKRRRLLNKRIACLEAEIARRFPLLDGEHVAKKGDRVTYLKSEWRGYPKGTVVWRRKTNRSLTCFVVPGAIAYPKKQCVVIEARVVSEGRPEVPALGAYEPNYGNAARELAKGLAGLGEPPLNFIGAFLINAFWPSGSSASTDWAEVYKNLQAILKNGLAEDKVNTASGKVKGFVDFLTNEYQALKADPKIQRSDLMHALAPYDVAFFMEIVNVFMYAEKPTVDIAAASLANFMLGANMHICLNQERALVDPNHVKDPENSAYAKTASNLAKSYADYARKVAPQIQTRRLAQVSKVKEDHWTTCGMGHCTTFYDYWFEDANNGYRSKTYSYNSNDKHPPPAEKQATQARNAYVKKVRNGLKLQSQVYDVADYWDKVAKDPIAMRYGPPLGAPSFDPDGWAGTVPVARSKRWVDGYKVRYAVSYVDGRKETAKGPWWSPEGAEADGYFAGSPKALPLLTQLPTDPFLRATARKIYRQFDGGKVEQVAVLKNNSDTSYQDNKG